MKAIFKSIPVGIGECLCLILENDDERFTIMIDCGKYNSSVKKYVRDDLKLHIDLLIVTHIDNDHVCGVTKMLNSEPDLFIGEVLFNSYQREPIKTSDILTPEQKDRIKRLKGNLDIIADIVEDSKINAEDARLLSEAIINYEKKNGREIWKRAYITNVTEDLNLGAESQFGKLAFLSPSATELQELDREFLHMFKVLFYPHTKEDFVNNTTIYELMIQYINRKDEPEFEHEKINSVASLTSKFFKQMEQDHSTETTYSNKASMAFMWLYNDIPRMLFLGDASHERIYESLKEKFDNLPLFLDLIKISHHGSKKNTSTELMNIIDSPLYIIPGGRDNGSPSYETLAKILIRPLTGDLEKRALLFSKNTRVVNSLAVNADKLTFLPKFSITFNEDPIEFTY